jgi:hypothetical protein
MNKTPFEIRLDVLKMAQEMLEADRRSSEKVESQKAELLKSAEVPVSDVINYIHTATPPKTYTEAEVLARATALYAFVNDKK